MGIEALDCTRISLHRCRLRLEAYVKPAICVFQSLQGSVDRALTWSVISSYIMVVLLFL